MRRPGWRTGPWREALAGGLMFLLGAPRRLRRWVGAVGLLLLSSSGLLGYLWWQGVHGGSSSRRPSASPTVWP